MRKFAKFIKYLIIAGLCLFVLSLATTLFFTFYRPPIQKTDAIVVLGAAINTQATYHRSLQGLALYEQGKADELVLSGGVDYPKSITEAEYMEKVIMENTSSTPKIILDKNSYSTYENIADTKQDIGAGRGVIIVSDSFHLARGVLLALRVGFHPVYWSAPSPTYYSTPSLIFYYFREAVALIDYIPKFIRG